MDSKEESFNACFEYEHRVNFVETDLAGIVHFSNFYRYMEATEHAFFRSLGHSVHEQVDGLSIGWPRVKSECSFMAPARFEDVLLVKLCIEEVRSRSVSYSYQFYKKGEDTILARGHMVTVCVSMGEGGGPIQAIAIPSELKEKLEAARSCGEAI